MIFAKVMVARKVFDMVSPIDIASAIAEEIDIHTSKSKIRF
jgi:hypothetical protein